MAVLTTAERIPGLVSVIMPFLNPPETFLREAVQSIEDQTYADWELLLVDDGSATPLSGVATRIADALSIEDALVLQELRVWQVFAVPVRRCC